eukprot:TRINITY_DN9076_c0_g1_i1.p1 TRINITY_DN9076_c0_g1~~TRINITY_DN9076_c0_g1_i1.p1  ORF type:complete len:404 (-),score=59.76 TRINITY_DN9076_c0_g1_i1:239-1450(-)
MKAGTLLARKRTACHLKRRLCTLDSSGKVQSLEKKLRPFAYGYFANPSNRREFVENFANHMGYSHWTDFYGIKSDDFVKLGGTALLHRYYNGSLRNAVMQILPEHDWDPSKFTELNTSWKDKTIADDRQFFDLIGSRLNIRRPEDWYKAKIEDVLEHGGSALMKAYGNSYSRAIMTVYPEYPWTLWRFRRAPRNFWQNHDNGRRFLDWAFEQLGLREMDDWYQITLKQLNEIGGESFTSRFSSLAALLKTFYPEHQWDEEKFHIRWTSTMTSRKYQALLRNQVEQILPEAVDIHSEFRHPTLKYESTQKEVQFDIFIPSLHLAFEFQGIQHYKPGYLPSSLTDIRGRDLEKKKLCESAGITLIEVPYWWDLRKESLVATLGLARPDLVRTPVDHAPIPNNSDR